MAYKYKSRMWQSDNITKYVKVRESIGVVLRELEILTPVIHKSNENGRGLTIGSKNLTNSDLYSMSVWRQIYITLNLDIGICNPMVYARCKTGQEVENLFRMKLVELKIEIGNMLCDIDHTLLAERLRRIGDNIEDYFSSQRQVPEFISEMLNYNKNSYCWK